MAEFLQLRDVCVWYPVRRGVLARRVGYVKAVDGISFSLERGQTLGLVGESGCGKTTLGRAIAGLEKPISGSILFDGVEPRSLSRSARQEWRRRCQLVFQDPFASLNPRMTALDIVTEGLDHYGMLNGETREEAARRLMLEVGLDPQSMYRYPHEFSGGQRQRLSIARSLAVEPEILILDEPVSALDVSVQAQIINLLIDLRQRRQLTYIFISHDLSVVKLIAHQVAVMYSGRLVEFGDAGEIMSSPFHPYTKALLQAIPVPLAPPRDNAAPPGEPAPPGTAGCPFSSRCPQVQADCRESAPELVTCQRRRVACHHLSTS